MRKLTLCAIALLVLSACASQEEPALAPPTDEPAATEDATPTGEVTTKPGGEAKTNDHGTKTFTEQSFTVDMELDDFYFEPTFIKSPGGSTATLKLHNEGDATHTFTVPDLKVDEELEPGASRTITVDIGAESRYDFHCSFHEMQGMKGAFQPH